MNKKKETIIIILFIIITTVVVTFGIHIFNIGRGLFWGNLWYQADLRASYVEDFDKYKNDYQVVADFAIKYKPHFHGDDKDIWLGVNTNDYIKINLSNNQTRKDLKLDKKVQKSLNNVYKSFYDEDNPIKSIRYNKSAILFVTYDLSYAIIYSPNDEKPKGFGRKDDEDYEFYVKKLDTNWYSIHGI